LSRVVGMIIAPDPTQLDEARWLSVVTQFSIPMSLFHLLACLLVRVRRGRRWRCAS